MKIVKREKSFFFVAAGDLHAPNKRKEKENKEAKEAYFLIFMCI